MSFVQISLMERTALTALPNLLCPWPGKLQVRTGWAWGQPSWQEWSLGHAVTAADHPCAVVGTGVTPPSSFPKGLEITAGFLQIFAWDSREPNIFKEMRLWVLETLENTVLKVIRLTKDSQFPQF